MYLWFLLCGSKLFDEGVIENVCMVCFLRKIFKIWCILSVETL